MDSAPLLCPNPIVPSPSQQAGSMSIWSYMTAAIVASTVASNMVNNVSLGVRSWQIAFLLNFGTKHHG